MNTSHTHTDAPRPAGPSTCIVALLIGLLVSTGCEENITPFIGTDFPFTLWGFVNPKADTQAVRVFTIDETLTLLPSEELDATVSIINADTQRRHVLQDSVTQLPNGDYRHTYWSTFDVEYGARFHVEVERSDGATTRSSVIKVPEPITINFIDPDVNAVSEIILPLEIIGNPPSMPRIDVEYSTFALDRNGNKIADNPVVISYVSKPEFIDDRLMLNIDVRQDFLVIRELFNDNDLLGDICTDDIDVRIHVGNEEWRSPVGVFDPNVLVEPGTLSNVENGFGFFGAGYVERISIIPPPILLVRAGFEDCISS